VLHREDELELVQELNTAARVAEKLVLEQSLYLDQQEAVFRETQCCQTCNPPYMCAQHYGYFCMRPYVTKEAEGTYFMAPEQNLCENSQLCNLLSIHADL
jgi:hypothetical protein